MPTTFETTREGRVLTVRIDHPPRNFISRRMVAELDELVGSLEGDGSIGAVVVTGAPPDLFVTHYDVEEILAGSEGVGTSVSAGVAGASIRAVGGAARIPGARRALERTPAAGVLDLRRIHDLFLRIERLDKVVLAAINGPALGGGCELTLACDLRYMAESSPGIGLPEMSLGFPPGAGGTQRLAHAIGPSRALEVILEARPLGPDEAFELGLVHRVLPDDELVAASQETATRLARRAPLSVAAAKRAVREGSARPLQEGLALERRWFLAAASQPAARRAMRAYAEQVRTGDAPAWADPEALRDWREGTKVDLVRP